MPVNKLTDLQVKEVSIVDRAANGRQFLVVKRADQGNVTKTTGQEDQDANFMKKFFSMLKGFMGQGEGAKDLNTILEDQMVDDMMWKLISALRESLDSIIDDDTITDKTQAVLTSLNQLFSELVGSGVIKSGRKISGARLASLKEMHGQLSNLINEAETAPPGGEEEETGDGKTKKAGDPGDGKTKKPGEMPCDPPKDEKTKKGVITLPDNTTVVNKEALSPELRKAFDDLEAKAGQVDTLAKELNDTKEVLKGMQDQTTANQEAALTKQYTDLAKSFQALPVNPAELGPALKTLAKADPAAFAQVEAMLKNADASLLKAGIFGELGKGGAGAAGSVMDRVEAMAKELVGKSTGMTIEKARAQVFRQNTDLYKEYQAELKG